MPTQITAVLDLPTLEQLIAELTPLKVLPGGAQDRFFTIERPSLVELIPGRGVRLRTGAHAQWTVAGVPLPLTIERVTLVLEPLISVAPDGGRLIFRLKLEELDVKNLPSIIEKTMVPVINEALAAFEKPLGWNFAKTLGRRFDISPKAAPLEAFTLAAGPASLEVTAQGISLKLALEMHFVNAIHKVGTPTIGTPTNRPATSSS